MQEPSESPSSDDPDREESQSEEISADEADSPEGQAFFRKKKAAAFLKHEILKYVRPFIAKTGKYSRDNRVVIMDGFAGKGRYDDGGPGSPIIIAEAAVGLNRTLECHFVEKDEATFKRLCEVLAEEASSIECHPWHGTAEDRLGHVLDRSTGLPLFLFIDPYDTGPDFDQVVEIFRRRPGGVGSPPTEVLYRIDASGLRRPLGIHQSGKAVAGRNKTLGRVDTVAGGRWWREDAPPGLKGELYLDWFFRGYLRHLTTTINCNGWFAEIKPKKELQPVYYLIFLTRSRDGSEIFGDNLSSATEKWRRKLFEMELELQQEKRRGQLTLTDPEDEFRADEARLADEWHDEIEQNIRALLGERASFVVRSFYARIFGSAAGLAREKHLREVLRRLVRAGLIVDDTKGKLYGKIVRRAPGTQA